MKFFCLRILFPASIVFLLTANIFAAETPTPIISLPTGVINTDRPRIEWRGHEHTAFHARVTSSPSPDSEIVWDSGIRDTGDFHISVSDAPLPADTILFCFVREKNDSGWTDWNSRLYPFRIDMPVQKTGVIHTYDLDYTRKLSPSRAFEHAHLAAALQGIVNREEPRLYLFFIEGVITNGDVDHYWLGKQREPGRWLERKDVFQVKNMENLVSEFRDQVNGVVLWDPDVPATSNIASTAAGAENLLPVPLDESSGSLYQMIVASGPELAVKLDLTDKFTGEGNVPDTEIPSTGSSKCDAYIWAVERYIKTGLCNAAYMGHYLDAWWINHSGAGGNLQNHTLTNHDYFIAQKGFFWDLNVWDDETPVDDPDQPLGADRSTLKKILQSGYEQTNGEDMIHIGGFTPWAFKYTNVGNAGGNHGAVATEWELVRMVSAYNGFIDADALSLSAMANASVFMHIPLPERYSQPAPPMPEELREQGILDNEGNVQDKTYLYHYVGDYDSSAWITNTLYDYWDTPERGGVSLSWALSPSNSDRARQFFEYAYRTRTANDTFVAGSSGAGYVNPTQIIEPRNISGLPSGKDAFQEHNSEYFRRLDYDFTGFVINGHEGHTTPEGQRLYIPFSGAGIVDLNYSPEEPVMRENMPVFYHAKDINGSYFGGIYGLDESDDGEIIASMATENSADFLMVRAVLTTPEYYSRLNQWLETNEPEYDWVFCNSDLFSYVGRKYAGGENHYLATYLFDDIPDRIRAGSSLNAEIAIRNDGWLTWENEGAKKCSLVIEILRDGSAIFENKVPLQRKVEPGDAVILEVELKPEAEPGPAVLRYEMMEGETERFSDHSDLLWENPVEIIATPTSWESY